MRKHPVRWNATHSRSSPSNKGRLKFPAGLARDGVWRNLVSRNAPALRFALALGPALGDEPVSHPGFGLDILPARLGLQLLAYLAHKHAQILRLMGRLRPPYGSQQGA